mgnify:CR=1 FL=1
MNKRTIGAQYEDMAVLFLQSKGVRILERNFRNRFGEIDIIGYDQDTYLFIEVKYRKTSRVGDPASAVTVSKQMTICKVADYYRVCHHFSEATSCRFDVITILGENISWYQNAFPYQHR